MVKDDLIKLALHVREKSYSPYSGFKVGAALLADDGRIFTGCNVENAAFSPTNCAERTAFFKAVSEGARKFTAIAVCGGHDEEPEECFPCGVCRQVMVEFCDPEAFEVIVVTSSGSSETYLLKELMPKAFSPLFR